VNVSCLYAIFRKFGDFWVPREMACFEDKHRLIDAKVEELSAEAEPDTTLFTPPRKAIELGRCSGIAAQPVPIFNPEPGYPTGADGEDTSVSLSLIVDTQGKPQDIKVSQSGVKLFDEKAVEAVQQWRYKPGTCEGEPMPMEVRATVVFNPQGMRVSPRH
jgi:TonB family protein